MTSLFCPACNGHIVLATGPVFDFRGGRLSAASIRLFAACLQCPVISEVIPNTGQLSDLDLSLSDLACPARVQIPAVHSLEGRRDS